MHKISVIVAAYNIEQFIERCLESVINQTYTNLDIVVVNDGSTDETPEILNRISKTDSRINIVNQENRGLLEARKSGFSNSIGDYVLFIDGDDWIEPNTVEVLYQSIIKENYDIVQCKYIEKYDDGSSKDDWDNNIGEFESHELMKMLLLGNVNHNIWTKLIKSSYIRDNNIKFLDGVSFGEDLAFTFSLFLNQPKVLLIDKVLYNYYQRANSLTNQLSNKVLEINKVLGFIIDELHMHNLKNRYQDELDYLIYRQSFFVYINYIFSDNVLGYELYKEWKLYNINILKNPYYKAQIGIRQKIGDFFYQKGYKLGKYYYKYRI